MQQFGGNHTADKLERVRRYLVDFTTLMADKGFDLAYIDAFAGSGSYTPTSRSARTNRRSFFPELKSREFDGSTRIALRVEPRFQRYIFIDKDPKNVAQLEELRDEHPDIRNRVKLRTGDANECLQKICRDYDWTRWRGVLLLDPYGMQVEWATIEAIARTHAIDLWYLFPLGIAVNRLLRQSGRITAAESQRLDLVFGSHDWYDAFYRKITRRGILSEYSEVKKTVGFKEIGEYFVDRLRSVFVGTARRPLRLYGRSNIPLYWLCFAAGDQEGADQRVTIAESILALPPLRPHR
jgi:three-Cys-motif partner protein